MTAKAKRTSRRKRIRAKISGSPARPRLSVFRSHTALSVQVIDDVNQVTLFGLRVKGVNIASAQKLGAEVGSKAKETGITRVVFDRGGYQYHGVVKALADAVRKEGIEV